MIGSDVHDKLVLAQALRGAFPDRVLFTTDLDARLLHPNATRYTRNVIVASSLPLVWEDKAEEAASGRPLNPAANRIAPFRDNLSDRDISSSPPCGASRRYLRLQQGTFLGGSNAALLRQRRSRGCLRSAATAWSSFRARTSRRPRKTSARLPPWSSSRCFWGSPDCCCSATQAPPCATPGSGGPARNRSRSICPTPSWPGSKSRHWASQPPWWPNSLFRALQARGGRCSQPAPLPRSSGCVPIPARLGCNRCGRAQGEPSSALLGLASQLSFT